VSSESVPTVVGPGSTTGSEDESTPQPLRTAAHNQHMRTRRLSTTRIVVLRFSFHNSTAQAFAGRENRLAGRGSRQTVRGRGLPPTEPRVRSAAVRSSDPSSGLVAPEGRAATTRRQLRPSTPRCVRIHAR